MLGQIGDILAEGQYVGGNRVLWSHGSEWKVDRTRTGFVAAELFLSLNGYELTATDADCVNTMLNVAAGALTEDAFAAWLRQLAQPRA